MKEPLGYADAEAKRIIKRAAEIDAEHGRQLNAPALRAIASEAGISPLAVDRAIQEHESAAQSRAPWFKRHRILATMALIVLAMVLWAFLRRATP